MKITKNILNKYVDIEKEDIKNIEEKLTMSGTKVETVESLRGKMKNIVVGKILEIKKHPDADKLVITKTDVKDEVLTIVTGADNIKVGDIVPVIKPNGILPNGVVIKPGKLRGVTSYGMLCSAGELGISVEESIRPDEDGILILDSSYEKILGEDVGKIFNMDDYILDFEITPNRPDCLGTLGIGRETAAAFKTKFNGYKIISSKEELEKELNLLNKDFKIVEKTDDLKIDIEDNDCRKYAAIIIENVNIKKTPKDMARVLKNLGVDSKGTAVDLTNYLMFELGQPLHSFDKEKLGENIVVRSAKKGETINLLNDKSYTLNEELVICAGDEVSAVAGVMGGNDHSVNEDTKNIVIEIANFNGPRIRRASKALGVRTDSSGRFEKTMPISYVYTAVKRVVELANELELGDIRKDIIIVGDAEDEVKYIEFNTEKINKHLGTNIEEKEMLEILDSLEFEVLDEKEKYIIKVPSFRKDVKIIEDLAEEVIRIHGYSDLPSTLPEFIGDLKENKTLDIKTDARYFLKDNGFLEICTYSFTNEKDLKSLNLKEDDDRVKNIVKLKNQLSEDQSMMRSETLSEFLNRVKYNLDMKNEEIKIFEAGRVYLKDKEEISSENLPKEESVLSILITKSSGDFYSLKEYIFRLINSIGGRTPEIKKSEDSIFHPGISGDLTYGKEVIASLGEVHPLILQNFGIKTKVYFAKINLSKIERYLNSKKRYTEISKYPSSTRDLSFVVDEEIKYNDIERLVFKTSKKLIEKVSLFDIFRDKERLGENKKSIAISIRFRSKDKTLDDEKVNEEIDKIVTALEKELKANLRK